MFVRKVFYVQVTFGCCLVSIYAARTFCCMTMSKLKVKGLRCLLGLMGEGLEVVFGVLC